MLFAAALIAGMPQALQTADQGDQAIEGIEEADEPLIADDLRTKEVMYASADVPRARSATQRKPGIVGEEGCYPRFVASQRSISFTGMPLRRA